MVTSVLIHCTCPSFQVCYQGTGDDWRWLEMGKLSECDDIHINVKNSSAVVSACHPDQIQPATIRNVTRITTTVQDTGCFLIEQGWSNFLY